MSSSANDNLPEGGGGGESSYNLSQDHIHDLLGNKRRRLVLEILRAENGKISVEELSDRIAEEESGESPPPRNIRQSVYVSLHQTHLEKLDNSGIIEYDTTNKTVTFNEDTDIFRYLDLDVDVVLSKSQDRTVGPRQIIILVASALLIGIGYLGLTSSLAVEPILFALFFVAAVALSSIVVQQGGAPFQRKKRS